MFRFSFTLIVIVLITFCTKVLAVAPVAEFTVTDTFPCLAETVTFTDQSTNTPASWLWAFTPATVTYTGGTSSASQNPKVQFNAYGTYQVSLTATNIDGGNTKTKTGYIVAGGLGGIYTIGPGGDYTTFGDAVSDLNALGICSSVTFNIIAALYTERISLGEIRGTSSANKVIFQSANGVNTSVILQLASSSTFSDPNYVVQLSGSDYVTFRNMTIQRTGSNLYARVVDFTGNASNNTFQGNRLIGRTGSTSNSGAVIISEDAHAGNTVNSFVNNIIQDGHAGIWWESASGNSKSALTISGNTFTNYRYGVYLFYVNDVVITNNSITNAASFNNAQLKGIDCFRCEQGLTVTKNTITLTAATSNYGIDLQASVGTALKVGNISNNMIIVGGTGTAHGINSGSLTAYKDYFFNSVVTNGTNATTSSAFYQNGSNNINLKNNIFAASPVGNAVEILTTSGLLSSDYNDLFTTGVAVGNWSGTNAATLAAWQSLTPTGFDVNSISADPQFTSATDLHASAPALQDVADPVVGIMDDIDGEIRDSLPDIGADEFSFSDPCFGFFIDSVTVNDISCFGSNDGEINVSIISTTRTIFYSIDSGMTVQLNNGAFTGLGSGVYDVMITSGGCVDVATGNPIILTEPAPFTAVITQNGNELTASLGSSYQWYINGNLIPNEIFQVYNAFQMGDYFVEVTDSNGCPAFSDTVTILAIAVNVKNGMKDFRISPNPAQDELEVMISLDQPSKIKLEIIDAMGKMVMTIPAAIKSEHYQKVDISELPQSLYLLKIQAGSKIYYRKFLKM